MSNEKKGIIITFEVNYRKFLEIDRYYGSISDVDLEALLSLMDKLGLKCFDFVKINKYIPTKEDFEE